MYQLTLVTAKSRQAGDIISLQIWLEVAYSVLRAAVDEQKDLHVKMTATKQQSFRAPKPKFW